MKLTFTRTILLAAVFTLVYTGCKKNTVKPAATATSTDYTTISSQTALTLYRSITGQYGGTDVSKGITSPFSTKTGSKTVFSTVLLCGFVTDTSYNYTTHTSSNGFIDTARTYSGNLRFQYTCTGGQVNGYIVDDSVGFDERNYAVFENTSSVKQHYTVKALDQTYKLVSMDGTITTAVGQVQTFAEEGSSLNASYVLSGLRVNFASGVADITTGTATFIIQYNPLHSFDLPYTPPAPYVGTIQFLGNHMAELTINPGHIFLVNLLTGTVTAV